MRKLIEDILKRKKAVPFSEPTEGGKFYKVMNQQFKLPSGEIITREFVEKRAAAVVVPITTEGNIVTVIQPISLVAEGSLIEVPAGYAENNEQSTQTAMRELVEETGYVPDRVICLGKHYQDPGCIKEPVKVFVALECERKQKQQLDEDEFISTLEISGEEVKQLMNDGEIKDANTFIALSKAIFAKLI